VLYSCAVADSGRMTRNLEPAPLTIIRLYCRAVYRPTHQLCYIRIRQSLAGIRIAYYAPHSSSASYRSGSRKCIVLDHTC
jgi:hypothetical protein